MDRDSETWEEREQRCKYNVLGCTELDQETIALVTKWLKRVDINNKQFDYVSHFFELWCSALSFRDNIKVIKYTHRTVEAYSFGHRDALWEYRKDRFSITLNVVNISLEELLDTYSEQTNSDTKLVSFLSGRLQKFESKLLTKIIQDPYVQDPEFGAKLNMLVDHLPLKNRQVLNLRTEEIFERTREHLFSVELPVDYQPKAECPKFLDAMNKVYNNPELVKFDQLFFGYCLTGRTDSDINCVVTTDPTDKWYGHVRREVVGALFGGLCVQVSYGQVLNSRKVNSRVNDNLREQPRLMMEPSTTKGLVVNLENLEALFDDREVCCCDDVQHPVLAKLVIEAWNFTDLDDKFLKAANAVELPCGLTSSNKSPELEKLVRNHYLYKESFEAELPGILNHYIQGAIEYIARGPSCLKK